MATKFEWKSIDYAAQRKMRQIINDSGLSLRVIAERMESGISFARVRDIKDGRRAPIKLSEFIDICFVCDVDPADALRQIIRDADRGIDVGNMAPASATRMPQPVSQTISVDGMQIPVMDLAAKYGDTLSEQEGYIEEP